LQLLQFFNHRC